jgi:hypothetical protein
MKALFALLVVVVVAASCTPQADTAAQQESNAESTTLDQTVPSPLGSGAAGGLTPMSGTEGVGGGTGGGIGQAAKDQAHRAAGSVGSGWQQDDQ